jgi:hypothetical protein
VAEGDGLTPRNDDVSQIKAAITANFAALRAISVIWKIAGYFALIGLLVLIAFSALASSSTVASFVFPITTRTGIVTLTRLACLGGGIAGVWISLLTIALGDLTHAVIQIEANTRR